jgi:hypothetical protein
VINSERQLLLHGAAHPVPERIPLRAGPLRLVLDAGDVRYISVEGREVVRRIYGAVRDRDWGTVPAVLSDLTICAEDDRFRVSYRSEHREGPIDFVWLAAIEGRAEGTLTFTFSGEARSTFERNRIGLCVLHPIRECAGRPATARLTNGSTIALAFPELVAIEQPIHGFTDLAGLTYDAGTGLVELAFEGDAFETEDQRNWIDASFKTYSTPLSRPRPVMVDRGTRVDQRVTLRLHTPTSRTVSMAAGAARDAVGQTSGRKAPLFGVGLGSLQQDFNAGQVELLSQLNPAHVRVDLSLAGDVWKDRLARALAVQRALRCGLEIALQVGPDSGPALECLATLLPHGRAVARVLTFARERPTTTAAAFAWVRAHLIETRPDLGPVGTGSRADLYELHLYPPPPADLLCWPMNPHAHASDLTSLAETPPAAAAQVQSVRARHPSVLTAITPITLRPRVRGSTAPPPGAHPLHRSLFGAAWTLAMAAHLARSGADSGTFYEGLEELTSAGDGVFPLLHVLADICECAPGTVLPTQLEAGAATTCGERDCSDEEAVLLVRRGSDAVLLLANLSLHPRSVRIPATFAPAGIRVLDENTMRRAAIDWSGFRREKSSVRGRASIELGAFATARLDGELMHR